MDVYGGLMFNPRVPRKVAKVQANTGQACSPGGKVRLSAVSQRGVDRETGISLDL